MRSARSRRRSLLWLATALAIPGAVCQGVPLGAAPQSGPQSASRSSSLHDLALELSSHTSDGLPIPARLTRARRQDAHAPTVDEIKVELVRQRGLREALGDSRWRRLQNARFRMYLQEVRPFEQLSQQDPYTFDDILDNYRSNFLKLARLWAEDKTGLSHFLDRRNAARASRHANRHAFSISPQIGGGDDPYIGTRLKLRGDSPIWSRLRIHTKHHLDSGQQSYRLSFQSDLCYFALEHERDPITHDRELSLNARWTF